MKLKIYILTFISIIFFKPSVALCNETIQISSSLKSIVFPLISPRLTSSFGSRVHPIKKVKKHHSGVDLAAPEKSHVRAVMAGRVVFAGNIPGYGNVVSILHEGERLSLYGHLREIHVQVGDVLEAGKIIGLVGSTGSATGPHLHFEWRENGKSLDPMTIFPFIAEDPLG